MSEKKQTEAEAVGSTTGHLWDEGLADLTNQPPRWWMIGLAASAVWFVVYVLYYPSFPLSGSGTHLPGLGGWSAIKEMSEDKRVVDELRGKYEARLKDLTPAQILADADLGEYVARSGKVLFGDNCAGCHGQNGIGTTDKHGLFAPILNDDDWLYGGGIDEIYTSIQDGRQPVMPAHVATLSAAEIEGLAKAVVSRKPTSTPLFAEKGCTACHAENGSGTQAMGGANLTDAVWRFESTHEGVKRTIAHGVNSGEAQGRVAVMPAFKETGKLTEAEAKKLAVYVFKLGGGQADKKADSGK